jgi:hypothetical protein
VPPLLTRTKGCDGVDNWSTLFDPPSVLTFLKSDLLQVQNKHKTKKNKNKNKNRHDISQDTHDD